MTNTPTVAPIAVLGAGSWGTALSLYLSRRGQHVHVWSIDSTEIAAMLADQENKRYLPGIRLPQTLIPTYDIEQALKGVRDILIVVPSVGVRSVLNTIKPLLNSHHRILCATKGIDAQSGNLLNTVAEEILGNQHPYAVLSGPSFAREVAIGLPAAVVMASRDQQFRTDLFQRFDSDIFNIHPSQDVIGVELGGIIKNVIAIAIGIADGLKLGANTQSALLTLGFAELSTLGSALGGEQETFFGLSGLGDLILTCSDNQSRNRRLGLLLGQGLSIKDAELQIGQVVEGKQNAELIVQLARKHQLFLPICETTWEILQGAKQVSEKLLALLHYKNI